MKERNNERKKEGKERYKVAALASTERKEKGSKVERGTG